MKSGIKNTSTGAEISSLMMETNQKMNELAYSIVPNGIESILEAGCANGVFIHMLITTHPQAKIIGFDPSRGNIKEALEINEEEVFEGQIKFEVGDFLNNGLQGKKFDCIISTNTIYTWPDFSAVVKEMDSLLNTNGKIILSFRTEEYLATAGIDTSHTGYTFYSISELESKMKSEGFECEGFLHTKDGKYDAVAMKFRKISA